MLIINQKNVSDWFRELFSKLYQRIQLKEVQKRSKGFSPVSYTHLDVYKRQPYNSNYATLTPGRSFYVSLLVRFKQLSLIHI